MRTSKLIQTLKKWNDAYPEYIGLLAIRLCDDESGHIETMDNESIFYFHVLKDLYSTDPQEHKKEHK
jgi:hypothetical protein